MFHIQPLLPKTLSILSKHSAGIYFFKAISGNTRTMCEIISKLTKKTLERLNGIFSGITNFIHFSGVDFEQVMPAGRILSICEFAQTHFRNFK